MKEKHEQNKERNRSYEEPDGILELKSGLYHQKYVHRAVSKLMKNNSLQLYKV